LQPPEIITVAKSYPLTRRDHPKKVTTNVDSCSAATNSTTRVPCRMQPMTFLYVSAMHIENGENHLRCHMVNRCHLPGCNFLYAVVRGPRYSSRKAPRRRNCTPRAIFILKIARAFADTTYMSSRRSAYEAQKVPADPLKGPEHPPLHPVRVDPVRVNAHPVRVFSTRSWSS
jgi:hypothetical protein